jgi:hypothetical protein
MSSDFSNLKKQAQYIDKAISDLNLKLAYPGSIFRPSRIPHTEEILEKLVSENEEICVNGHSFYIKPRVYHTLHLGGGGELQDQYTLPTQPRFGYVKLLFSC